MATSSIKVEWKPGVLEQLTSTPQKIMMGIARMTLDMAYPTVPMSKNINSGRLRRAVANYGVKVLNNGVYSIGTEPGIANYDKYVYAMNDNTTNWTTPGTHSAWFKKTWQENNQLIEKTIVERYRLK